MESSMRFRPCPNCFLLLSFLIIAAFIAHCGAKRPMPLYSRSSQNNGKKMTSVVVHRIMSTKKLQLINYLDMLALKINVINSTADQSSLVSSNTQPYVSSPFTLPPFDSLPPIPLPDNVPPFCLYPPNTPNSPSTVLPSPTGSSPTPPFYYLPPTLPIQNSPPPGPITTSPRSPPVFSPTPNTPPSVPSPTVYVPTPPAIIFTPPYFVPSPPSYVLSPPSPTVFVPSPPVFQPPVVYPPPKAPPTPSSTPSRALWCVAKPSVPDPIIQEAMNYACGSGADCDSIQPSGSCFQPNTLIAHASYAFNSYWQRTKVGGGTCEFGGTAMLVTVDPSYDGCHFIYF